MVKVLMIPHASRLGAATSGIARVVEGYFKYLPQFGVELVPQDATSYDLDAVHAGMTGRHCTVCHSHGWYWTADYEASEWEWKTNVKVTEAARHAKVITVPSEWVAESVRRDMHIDPWVIPHGIDADEWDHNFPSEGYVLWNKNRTGDVCDVEPLDFLATRFPGTNFVSTFQPETDHPNIRSLGVIPPDEMKGYVQRAAVYLATTKETFGIGLLESMASGVPILGFDHGGASDVVQHGVNGYLAPPGDYSLLADGLNYCLQYRDILGSNGRELAKGWSWQSACELVAKAYEEALIPSPPTAAIIIPSYNYAHLVGGAVQSAIEQFYNQLTDIIVVDDGSDDGGETERVIQPYIEKDSRVWYVKQPNAGVANARNFGISMTDAKYICCLDADDSLAPTFLNTLIPPMEADPALGIAYTSLMLVSHQGDSVDPAGWPHECDFDRQLQADNQVPTCCLFRRSAWQRLGGYRQRYAPHGCGTEDAEFWLRVGAAGFDIQQVTTEPLFLYRMGGSTTSGRVRGTEWLSWHPWTYDNQHPFASIATPTYHSHPVRQYDEPIVSVIIPVGPGHEHIVIDALDSLEAQTMRRWEAIVVWDSEADPYVLDSYPFVRRIVTGGHHGAGYSRNRGAEIARGPFLIFLDADDYLFPDALSRMLIAFSEAGEDGAIVYSDSHGHMIIDALQADTFDQKGDLISYDARTQLATIINRPDAYDYDRAVLQPDLKRPYFWCYISSLTPQLWHNEIGGFDESLPAWEDWDYWLRMARAGKPFMLVPEPLLVYRFYSGQRRETGRGIKKDLMDHLVNKFKEVEVMSCRGCKQRRTSRGVRSAPARQSTPGTPISDTDMVRAKYTHPNRGQHAVYGAKTKIFYGQRGGGEEFYVHRIDMEALPQFFKEVRETPRQVIVTPAQTQAAAPPPPVSLTEPPVKAKPDESTYDDFLARMRDISGDETPPREVTLDELPGISPTVALLLAKSGVTTPEQLFNLGEEGLQKVRGVGPVRAGMIIESVQGYLAEMEKAVEMDGAVAK